MKLTACALWTGLLFGWMAIPGAVVRASEASGAGKGIEAPLGSSLHELLLRAVRERRLLHFSYAGHARVFEPHAYGVSPTGETVLHGYQTAGGSTSEPPPGWRTFVVANMSDVVVARVGYSGPRKTYAAEALKLEPLWAEVAASERTKPAE